MSALGGAGAKPPDKKMERAPVKFYREVLASLTKAKVPFLVGGAFAFCRYAGIDRRTKDLDLMIEERTWPDFARVVRAAGIHTRLTFPHWLGKALSPAGQVDVIFNGGAGLTPVDAEYFTHGVRAPVLGFDTMLCPAEELIWSKAFIMERERFDGADVLHLIRALGDRLDWRRLRRRFAGHEPVLRAHLILFKYAYPSEASQIPDWLEDELIGAIPRAEPSNQPVCRGTYLSRAQYLVDVDTWGYADGRLAPFGTMTERNWLIWTNAIDAKRAAIRGGKRRAAPRAALQVALQET
ncbi:MAG TPA: hypothetical protein VN700_02915 [Vicinamibacterales bacterium]|nr:hypothetical protein [Vicinamibacterales bacterium]